MMASFSCISSIMSALDALGLGLKSAGACFRSAPIMPLCCCSSASSCGFTSCCCSSDSFFCSSESLSTFRDWRDWKRSICSCATRSMPPPLGTPAATGRAGAA